MQIELITKKHSTPTLFAEKSVSAWHPVWAPTVRRGFVLGVVGAPAFLHNPQPALHSKKLNPQESLHSTRTPDLIREQSVKVFQPLIGAIVENRPYYLFQGNRHVPNAYAAYEKWLQAKEEEIAGGDVKS